MGFRQKKARVIAGSVAPNFTLPSQSGEMVSLGDFLGKKPVVLFFYPKDNTLGCTKEVCAFRDSFEELGNLDAGVIGISSDSVDSHKGFAEKHTLPFTLLSDEGGKVRRLYGVSKSLGIFAGRVTYVIDEDGVVRHVFSSQIGVEKHLEEALKTLESIRAYRAIVPTALARTSASRTSNSPDTVSIVNIPLTPSQSHEDRF